MLLSNAQNRITQFTRLCVLTMGIVFVLFAPVKAEETAPKVIVSIRPIHSLVAAVMEGRGKPALLVEQGSPHGFALKPSQAKSLANADLIFWVGHDMERFMVKPVKTLSASARSVELANADGVVLLERRSEHYDHGDQETHHEEGEHTEAGHGDHGDHGQHKHDKHNEHDHDKDDKHEEAEHKHDDHGHEHSGAHNMHIWLDPENAIAMARLVAEKLAEHDPEFASLYNTNAQKLIKRLQTQQAKLSAQLSAYKNRLYVVFHDAFYYFEKRFDLAKPAVIRLDPEIASSVKHISEIRHMLAEKNVKCVFAEPQFDGKLVKTLIQDTRADTGTIDPLGQSFEPGPELYPQLLNALANNFQQCFDR